MLNFQNSFTPGELWLRDPNGNRETATKTLSAIYDKYHTLNPSVSSRNNLAVFKRNQNLYDSFYQELITNQIVKFDVFYDNLFIQTKSGCVFEKIYVEEGQIKPFTISDNFTAKHTVKPHFFAYDSSVDYWFDEANNKVFFAYIAVLDENKNFTKAFSFALIVNEYNCSTGLTKTVVFWKIYLAFTSSRDWSTRDSSIEDPKLTYNSTTKTFNFSFLLKNTSKELGLISINLKQTDEPYRGSYSVSEVNGFLSFLTMDPANCQAYPYDPNIAQPYYVVTVSSDKQYDSNFILLTVATPESIALNQGPVTGWLTLD